jgi:hypothetical protein
MHVLDAPTVVWAGCVIDVCVTQLQPFHFGFSPSVLAAKDAAGILDSEPPLSLSPLRPVFKMARRHVSGLLCAWPVRAACQTRRALSAKGEGGEAQAEEGCAIRGETDHLKSMRNSKKARAEQRDAFDHLEIQAPGRGESGVA